MSDRVITERHIRHLKRQAKVRAREDSRLSYMQHLEAVSQEQFGCRFQDIKANTKQHASQNQGPLSFYLQACQDAYFDL